MTPEMSLKLKRSLIAHEGLKHFPYTDTVGKVTIGIGYNLTDRGVTSDWINQQYAQDVDYFYNQLSQFPWFHDLNEDRQIVLIDMSFMGIKRFLGFHDLIAALERKDYTAAAQAMLDSEWAKEVKDRATQLAHGMETGAYDV